MRLCRIGDVADQLAVGRTTVRAMAASGELVAIRRGRIIRIEADSVERWVTTHVVRDDKETGVRDREHLEAPLGRSMGSGNSERASRSVDPPSQVRAEVRQHEAGGARAPGRTTPKRRSRHVKDDAWRLPRTVA